MLVLVLGNFSSAPALGRDVQYGTRDQWIFLLGRRLNCLNFGKIGGALKEEVERALAPNL